MRPIYDETRNLIMNREISRTDRSLIGGLLAIYRSSPILALCSFLLIILISSIIPLSIFWLIQMFLNISIISISSSYLSTFLTIWSTMEVLFLIYQSYLYSRIQRKTRGPHLTSVERNRLVSRVLSNMKNLQYTLSKWFMNRPFQDIDRRSIFQWLAFAFFSNELEELTDEEYDEIDVLIRKIEIDYQLKITGNETNRTCQHMKHILDPVHVIFRPLAFYLLTDTLLNGILCTNMFYLRGYQNFRIGHLSFWMYHDKVRSTKKEENDPIVFFHGIGAGLLMYHPFLAYLRKKFSQQRRIIVISMRCICMRYPSLNDIPNMKETIDSLELIFEQYQLKKAIFVGHSYGTVCLSWIIQKCPQYISRLVFLDPICFALFEPYVVYNFVYRIPYKLKHLYMYYFVCRELGISYVISRHFWWTQNNLFFEQIPSFSSKTLPIHVLLSGQDCIVNVHLIKDYLVDNNVDYYWASNLSHGGYMHDQESWDKICQWIA